MVYSKEKFKELWEANEWGSSITYDDIADCAVAWGISYPRLGTINEIAYKVLKAAQVNDAEEYNPNPAPMKREEIGCGYCIHEEVCEKRKNRTITTRKLAKECGHFIHYKVLDESTDWKYKGALERAKEMCAMPTDKATMEYIFPELKESEDERMREMAIKAVHAPEAQSCIKSWGINPDDVIAWLEKQGKQKQPWEPTAAQLIVIKDLIEDKNTSKVNKVILRGMFDEFKQYFGL